MDTVAAATRAAIRETTYFLDQGAIANVVRPGSSALRVPRVRPGGPSCGKAGGAVGYARCLKMLRRGEGM
jgi:hypothetical protein